MTLNSKQSLIKPSLLPGSTGGFTLMELMIVLIIMSISIGLLMPRIGAGWRRLEDRDFLQEFIGTLRAGRLFAMNSGEVAIFRIRGSERLFGLGEPQKPIPENVDVYSDRLESDPETKDKLIVFFPDGSLSGGSMEIVFDQVRSYRIDINPLFGTVQTRRVERR